MAWTVYRIDSNTNITDSNDGYEAVVKNNIKGVLIRLGYRNPRNNSLVVDQRSLDYADNFVNKTRISFYFETDAINAKEAEEEAAFIINYAKRYKLYLPIYIYAGFTIDIKGNKFGRSDNLDNKTRREQVLGPLTNYLKRKGYRAGIISTSTFMRDNLGYNDMILQYNLSYIESRDTNTTLFPNSDGFENSARQSNNVMRNGWIIDFKKDVGNFENYDDYKIDISTIKIDLEPPEQYTYNDGMSVEPWVIVSDLKAGTDYTLTYYDNKNVSSKYNNPRLVITGIGKYTGTVTKTFGIMPKEIDEYQYVPRLGAKYYYTGQPIEPSVEFQGLTLNKDYQLLYWDNVNVGTGWVQAFGINNITGSRKFSFQILAAKVGPSVDPDPGPSPEPEPEPDPIPDSDISYTTSWVYTGRNIMPEVKIKNLKQGTDYDVTYSDNVNVGTAKIKITGKGNYAGVNNKTFTITQQDIAGRTITLNPTSYTYTGSSFRPSVSISGMKSSDYNVSYSDNINVGTAKVTVTGKGNYKGTISTTFRITSKSIKDDYKIETIPDYEWTSKAIVPEVKIPGLVYNRDYTVSFSDNVNLGNCIVTATGIGNYSGQIITGFEVKERDINTCICKYGRATPFSPYRVDDESLLIKYNDYTLEEGIDYEVESIKKKEKEKYNLAEITARGIGNFKYQCIFRFRVIEGEPDIMDPEDDGKYNFEDIEVPYDDLVAEGDYNYLNIRPKQYEEPHAEGDYDMEEGEEDYDFFDVDEDPPVYGNDDGQFNFQDLDEFDPTNEDDYDTDIPDNTDYDFEEFCGVYLGDFDIDNGHNIGPEGEDVDPYDPDKDPYPDDGVFNFGDIDLGDETAEGNFDFGDLDEGISEDTVVGDEKNYDFDQLGYSDFVVGDEYVLDNTPIYANYCSTVSSGTRSGSHFVYKRDVRNERVRLTKLEEGCGAPVRTAGWFNINDLRNLGKPKIDEAYIVSGRLYKYTNGNGNYFDVRNQLMYVVDVSDDSIYENPYGLSYTFKGARAGWAAADIMERVQKEES